MTRTDLWNVFETLRLMDQLKCVERRNPIGDGSRRENSAEHSWHISLFAVLIEPILPVDISRQRVLELLIVHELPEVFVGDSFAYDTDGHGKDELHAVTVYRHAHKLNESVLRLADLWHEFERGETKEAKWAQGLDIMMPILLNSWAPEASSWVRYGIRSDQVRQRLARLAELDDHLHEAALQIVNSAALAGILREQ